MYEDQNYPNTDPQNENPQPQFTYQQPQPMYEQPQPVYEQPAAPRFDPYVQPSKKKSGGFVKLVVIPLCCALVGGIIGAGTTMLLKNQQIIKPQAPISNVFESNRENGVLDVHRIDTSKLMTPAEVYATNVGSTVGITTAITTNFWGYQTTSAASGSGFILTDDGYVLTNYHVVEGSSSISVAMYDGKSYDAQLIGYDENNDIAVLKIDATDLTPVILGDSDNLNVGDDVVAIGNPLGELTFSLTSGAISALDRTITMQNGTTMNLMQTDCAINSGNSGGALFNMYGEVIGITNAKYSSNGNNGEASIDNIGFAIPMNHARKIFESIIEKGYYSKPYIGVSVTDVSEETQSYGLPKGAAVKGVVEGSPAQKAGLQLNDIITEANGTAISGSQELVTLVGKCEPGDTLALKVYRQGQTLDITITVAEQMQTVQQQPQDQQNQQQPQQQFPFIPGFGGW
ncbi:MAG: trypsin-like peptidase domain-containing protein [Oscillospiraceae bacterium]|nr:trypsin-like peptidase domain-containing protein [Oscillospiraceae bacterium]